MLCFASPTLVRPALPAARPPDPGLTLVVTGYETHTLLIGGRAQTVRLPIVAIVDPAREEGCSHT